MTYATEVHGILVTCDDVEKFVDVMCGPRQHDRHMQAYRIHLRNKHGYYRDWNEIVAMETAERMQKTLAKLQRDFDEMAKASREFEMATGV